MKRRPTRVQTKRGTCHGYAWWSEICRFVRLRQMGDTVEADISDGYHWPSNGVERSPTAWYQLYQWWEVDPNPLAESPYFARLTPWTAPICRTVKFDGPRLDQAQVPPEPEPEHHVRQAAR